jgi:hypothetical protein
MALESCERECQHLKSQLAELLPQLVFSVDRQEHWRKLALERSETATVQVQCSTKETQTGGRIITHEEEISGAAKALLSFGETDLPNKQTSISPLPNMKMSWDISRISRSPVGTAAPAEGLEYLD